MNFFIICLHAMVRTRSDRGKTAGLTYTSCCMNSYVFLDVDQVEIDLNIGPCLYI